MIQKIKLRNFQSLKDVTLSLGRVTILSGKSDVGKSAVIRALNAFFNNSFNQEYAHNGQLPFGVAIQKDGRVTLGRRTTKGVEYKLDTISYSKTAKKIPQDISNFLGIYPYSIDVDMSVFFQIQKQFDQPFLLADSATTVAKIIGRVSNLNIVLMAMREMFASQLENKQEINFLYNKKKSLKEKLLKFSNFEDYESAFKHADSLSSELDSLYSKKTALQDIITRGSSLNSRISRFNKSRHSLKTIDSVLFLLDSVCEIRLVLNSFNSLSERSDSLKDNVSTVLDKIDELVLKKELYSSLFDCVSVLNATDQRLNSCKNKNLDVLDFLDIHLLENLYSITSLGSSFNTRLSDFKLRKASFKQEEDAFADLQKTFLQGKVICPFSNLEMQEYCKNNIL